MTITVTSGVNRIRDGATHTIEEVRAANTANIRRQGAAGSSAQYDFHNSTIRVESGRLILNSSAVMTDNVQLKIEIQNGGVLQIGQRQTLYEVEYSSAFRPIVLNLRGDNLGIDFGNPVAYLEDSAQLIVRAGGRLELFGSTLVIEEGNLWFENGAEFFCRDARIYSDGQRAANRDIPRMLFFGGSPANSIIDVDGLDISSESGLFQPFVLDQPPSPGLSNYRPVHCRYSVQFNVGSDGSVLELASTGNQTDILFNTSDGTIRTEVAEIFVRSLDGKILEPGTRLTDRHQPWIQLQYIDWTFSAEDSIGSIAAQVYLRDTDNGQRDFAFASGRHKNDKLHLLEIPDNASLTERLIIAVSDRGLDTNSSPLPGVGTTSGAPNPPIDRRGPVSGWIRSYGYLQLALSFDPLQNAEITYLLARNRSIEMNQADADAITGVSVIIHDAPVSWNGLQWSITIQVDGPTASQAWHYVQSQIAKITAFGGLQAGIIFHDLWPSVDRTDSGIYVDRSTSVRRGVRVIDAAGNPLPGVNMMESDDESTYIPPISASLTITGIEPGSEIVIKISGSTLILLNERVTGTAIAYNYVYPGFDRLVDVFVNQEGFNFFVDRERILGIDSQSLTVTQSASTAYAE